VNRLAIIDDARVDALVGRTAIDGPAAAVAGRESTPRWLRRFDRAIASGSAPSGANGRDDDA